jgi:tetratricopeptide (TPR) repeat protein
LNVTGPGTWLTPAEKKMSVAVTYDKLGTLAFNRGNTDEAQPQFEKALALRESVLEQMPTDEVRRMLAQSHFFLGAVEMRRPDPDTALEHYTRAQAYRRQVYEANRNSFQARGDLADLSEKIGQMQMAKKDYKSAHENLDENLKLRRELYAADTNNAAARRRLLQACSLAAAAAQACGDKTAAKADFNECVRLRRDALKAAPDDINAHIELAKACARAGDHAEAVRIAEEVVRKRAAKNFHAVFQIACCYSLCLDAVEAEEDKAKYAAKGVEALQEARALGHKDVKPLDTEPDLEPLRQRPEFQAFRKTLPQ